VEANGGFVTDAINTLIESLAEMELGTVKVALEFEFASVGATETTPLPFE
jgi:hypothetical protein